MFILFLDYILFTHLLAWPCGSIHKGHLLALNIIIPFYILKESDGKPCIFHSLISTGFPNTCYNEYLTLEGICFCLHLFTHYSTI